MNRNIKKIIRICSGILLIIGGIIGLFLPVIQGIVMILLGILLIHPPLRKKFIKPFKKIYHKIKKEY